jgi:hypothetical protein
MAAMDPAQRSAPQMSDAVQAAIDEAVKTNDVVLFMKGTPTFPQCGFSSVVVQILDVLGVEYVANNVLEDQAVREGIKLYSRQGAFVFSARACNSPPILPFKAA